MIKLMKSTFFHEKETKEALCDFITQADKLSIGDQCDLFEKNFAQWQGRKYCVFFNSGSSANLALLQSLLNQKRIRPGAKIGFSAVTWATNVMPIIQLGCTPVPIDVRLETLNVSSAKLMECLKTYELDCLFITHLLGMCDDFDEIRRICEEKKIILLEDTCESMGTVYRGKKLGDFGLASTFSTYVGHHLSTIEGGMVCTDDEELYFMLKMVRSHGWDRSLPPTEQKRIREMNGVVDDFYAQYTFYVNGYNLRPTEVNGFLGNFQLPFLDKATQTRFENFKAFSKIYSLTDLFYPCVVDHIDYLSNFAVPVVCRSKDVFRRATQRMIQADIEIRPVAGGSILEQPFYLNGHPHSDDQLPNAKFIHEHAFYFGNNPELTPAELDHIISTLCSV